MKNKAMPRAPFQLIVLLMLVFLSSALFAEVQPLWHNPKASLYKVFKKDHEHGVEVIKLFKDGKFDRITYTYGREKNKYKGRPLCQMQRDTGIYTISLNRLVLKQETEPNAKNKKQATFWILNGKSLYTSPGAVLAHFRTPDFTEAKGRNYRMPFYIEPRVGVIVDNAEAMERIDLAELVSYITKGAGGDRAKFLRIANFIMNSMSYAYEALTGDDAQNAKYTTVALLAGPYRQGVCGTYSWITRELCDSAKLNCRVVIGAARNSLSDLNVNQTSNHAWNILSYQGKQEIYDITWEDAFRDGRWMQVDPAVMIYTHFPDKKTDQLLPTPMTRDAFNKSPMLEPAAANAHLNFSFPSTAKLYTDSDLVITMKGNFGMNRAYLYSSDLGKVIYQNEEHKKRSYYMPPLKTIQTNHNGDLTTLRIPIAESRSILYFDLGAITLSYLVIKGNRLDYFKQLQAEADRRYIDSYIKAVVASMVLNDVATLSQLTGKDRAVFLDKKGKVKLNAKSLQALREWDGNLYNISVSLFSKDPKPRAVLSTYAGPLFIEFTENKGEFNFLSMVEK